MANKSLFKSAFGFLLPKTNTTNEAGGTAYSLTPKQALAQYAATGCLNSTFYATANDQLETFLALGDAVPPEFLAKVALYSRGKGNMKDTPALLVAMLSIKSPGLMAEVFDRVIDSPKMLRNFVQIMRSGQVGRKSLGTLPKRMVLQWLADRTDDQLFRGSVGNSPSLADVVRMVHPKPATASRAALLGYLVGKPYDAAALPELLKQFEAFKAVPDAFVGEAVPEVPMEMLTSLDLTEAHWKALARRASWQSLRMNLSAFARHKVFADEAITAEAAAKLRDPTAIAKARVLPYQLLAAFYNASDEVPTVLKNALQDAMEVSISNVPAVSGKVWVLPDVSGSMHAPVTGHRKGATTKVRCADVAALVAAAILRKNPDAGVLPFSTSVVPISINPRDSVMTNARVLASLPSGGTDCSAPMRHLNDHKLKGDLVIYVSDNESWMDSVGTQGNSRGSATMEQWRLFQKRNPGAKLVCLDVQPTRTTQAPNGGDVLNIGGFTDSVFSVISDFCNNTLTPDHWISVIEKESI